MKYLVAGPTIVNDILHEDGSRTQRQLGGAIFCLAGIKLWCDDVLYISHVGRDFSRYYGQWMEQNGCSCDGLDFCLPHTQYTLLTYGAQGLHSEESVYGPEEEALVEALDKPDAGLIARHCTPGTRGIYVEAGERDDFWNHLDRIRERCNASIMWEIPTSAAMDPARRDGVLSAIGKAGLYSINGPEAMCLFAASDEGEAIQAIHRLGVPCYFRVGARGSYLVAGGQAHFAPSVDIGRVVDPTGCGNCSTAAALYAWCEGLPPVQVAAAGNIAAAYNLLQYGPYPRYTAETRDQAKRLLEQSTATA